MLHTSYGLHLCKSRLLCAHISLAVIRGNNTSCITSCMPVPERSRIGYCQTSEGVPATSSPSQAWSSHEPIALGLYSCWCWSQLVVPDHWQQDEPCTQCICEHMCQKTISHLYACLKCSRGSFACSSRKKSCCLHGPKYYMTSCFMC